MRSAMGALSRGLGRHVPAPPSARAPQVQQAAGLRASGPHPDRQVGLFSSQRALQASTQAAALAPGSNVALVDDAYCKLEGTKASNSCIRVLELPCAWRTLAACRCAPAIKSAPDPAPRSPPRSTPQVFLASSQEEVAVTSLWGDNERAVIFFGRSAG